MDDSNQKQFLTALIGSPVGHSLSPYIHNNAYALLSMEGSKYVALECVEDDISDMVKILKEKNFTGFNVTMPLKKEIIKYCDEVSDDAELIQGVNTVKIVDGRLKGYNTDCQGFFMGIEKAGFNPEKKTMILFGSGGAARAILTGAAVNDMKRVNVFARKGMRFDETMNLVQKLRGADTKINMFDIEDEASLYESVRMSEILVNATSVGMKSGDMDLRDISLIKDVSCLKPHLFVADIVYRPKTTALLQQAQENGCTVMNGIPMLFCQAALSFEIWHKKKMPEAILERLKEI